MDKETKGRDAEVTMIMYLSAVRRNPNCLKSEAQALREIVSAISAQSVLKLMPWDMCANLWFRYMRNNYHRKDHSYC